MTNVALPIKRLCPSHDKLGRYLQQTAARGLFSENPQELSEAAGKSRLPHMSRNGIQRRHEPNARVTQRMRPGRPLSGRGAD